MTRDQSRILFDAAREMVRRHSPADAGWLASAIDAAISGVPLEEAVGLFQGGAVLTGCASRRD